MKDAMKLERFKPPSHHQHYKKKKKKKKKSGNISTFELFVKQFGELVGSIKGLVKFLSKSWI